MDEKEFIAVIDEAIKEVGEILDEIFKEYIDPLTEFGSPAKVIGKPYEQWTPADHARAQAIKPEWYENGGYVARKEVDAVLKLEAEVNNG